MHCVQDSSKPWGRLVLQLRSTPLTTTADQQQKRSKGNFAKMLRPFKLDCRCKTLEWHNRFSTKLTLGRDQEFFQWGCRYAQSRLLFTAPEKWAEPVAKYMMDCD